MKETITTAAATAFAVVSTMFSAVPVIPPAIAPAMVAISVMDPYPNGTILELGEEPAERTAVSPAPPAAAETAKNDENEAGETIGEREVMIEKTKQYARKYGVNEGLMVFTVRCETGNTFDPKIQSFMRYTFSDAERGIVKGDRERSFGLSQIHLPDNRGITKEQAQDPDFALDFMARHLAAGDFWRWSCLVK